MKRGFTVLELVLVIALLGIEAFMLGPPLAVAVKEYVLVSSRRHTLAEAQSAMDRMVKEIRLIPSSAAVINVSTSTSFQFKDLMGNSITYALSGTDLQRNGQVVASNVALLEFVYYAYYFGSTTTPSDVQMVQIRLTLNTPSNQGTVPLMTTVYLRNTGNVGTKYNSFMNIPIP